MTCRYTCTTTALLAVPASSRAPESRSVTPAARSASKNEKPICERVNGIEVDAPSSLSQNPAPGLKPKGKTYMKTKRGLLSILIPIAVVLLGSGPVLANEVAGEEIQHSPPIPQWLKDSFLPGFPRASDTPYISAFNTRGQQRYPFADELEKTDERPHTGAFDSLNTPKPTVGNIFRFSF